VDATRGKKGTGTEKDGKRRIPSALNATLNDEDSEQQQWDFAYEGDASHTEDFGDFDFENNGETLTAAPAGQRHSVPVEVRCFDTAKICVRSGKGGDGSVSFRREKYVPRGGPDGGNGGRGGHVWVVAEKGLNSLSSFRNQLHFRAKKGKNGLGRNQTGGHGSDVEVKVPIGTIIRKAVDHTAQGEDNNLPFMSEEAELSNPKGRQSIDGDEDLNAFEGDLASEFDNFRSVELLEEGQRKLLLHGGRGGRGNTSFRNSNNKTPRLAESGEDGLEQWFELELKLVADVGIVGAPNAGKSTLLASLSNAKPKIAAYPFTTLVPNLGVCDMLGYKSIVFADVPGLLEGAHTGVGLGQEFLRHCERCNVLVQVIDGDSPDPLGDFHAIRTELELFSESLSTKPFIVAINKIDIPDVLDKTKELQQHLKDANIEMHAISAVARQGVDPLVQSIDSMLTRFEKEQQELYGAGDAYDGGFTEDGFPDSFAVESDKAVEAKKLRRQADKATLNRDFSDFSLHFEGATRTWFVKGRAIESFVQMTDWQYYQAWKRFRKIIKVSGLYTSLKRKGVKNGDTVVIGSREFEWNNKMDEDLSFKEWKAFSEQEE
jgi:GTP-binding protein